MRLRRLEHNNGMTSRNEVTQIMRIMRELCKYTWRETPFKVEIYFAKIYLDTLKKLMKNTFVQARVVRAWSNFNSARSSQEQGNE